jgi:hypothetical protein
MQMKTGPAAGKWHYCQSSRDGGYPIGYCCPWEVCPECLKTPHKVYDTSQTDDCTLCHGKRRVDRPAPCPGHDTEAGAQEHYREYLLDNARYSPETPEARAKVSQLHRCAAVLEGNPRDLYDADKRKTVKTCGEFTCGMASYGPYAYQILCLKHCNREFLAPLVSVGESWES